MEKYCYEEDGEYFYMRDWCKKQKSMYLENLDLNMKFYRVQKIYIGNHLYIEVAKGNYRGMYTHNGKGYYLQNRMAIEKVSQKYPKNENDMKKSPVRGLLLLDGGDGGIRTHGRFNTSTDFESVSL